MDGVSWKNAAPFGNALKFSRASVARIENYICHKQWEKTPEEYQKKLADLGVKIEPWQNRDLCHGIVFMLAQKYPKGTKMFHDR